MDDFSNPNRIDTLTGETFDLNRITDLARIGPRDTILVAGSLIEGMGNPLSDFDVIVLCEAVPQARHFRTGPKHRLYAFGDKEFVSQGTVFGGSFHTVPDDAVITNTYDVVSGWGTRCDVEYINHDQLNRLLDRLHKGYERLADSHGRGSTGLNIYDYQLLHRLRVGRVLQEGEALASARARLPQHLLSYVLYRRSLPIWSDFQDMIGFYLSGREVEFRDIALTYLDEVAASYNFALGNTNPSRKWLCRYLEASGDALALELVELITKSRLSPPSMRELADQVLALTDRAMQRAVEIMQSDPLYPDPAQVARHLKNASEASGLTDRSFLAATEFLKRQCTTKALPAAKLFSPDIYDRSQSFPELGKL